MVKILLAKRRQLFQPLVNILNKASFVVIHVHSGGNVHRRNQRHAVGDSAVLDDLLHLRRNVDVLAMLFGVEG